MRKQNASNRKYIRVNNKICNTCNVNKDIGDFQIDRINSKDGHSQTCKACKIEYEKRRIDNLRKNRIIHDKDEKICTSCGNVVKLSKYHKNNNSADGYEHRCIDCSKLYYNTDRYRRAKLNIEKSHNIRNEEVNNNIIKPISDYTILYFVKFTHNCYGFSFYKIGITSLSIYDRFKDTQYNDYRYITLGKYYYSAEQTKSMECILLNEHRSCGLSFKFPHQLYKKFGGYSECFTQLRSDILQKYNIKLIGETMIEKIEEMRKLQKAFNDATNGVDWELGVNKFGKEIDWYLAINLEASECIESTPYKWWKNIEGEVDWENVHIELVDIWHFILSQSIVDKLSIYDICSSLSNNRDNINLHNYSEMNKSIREIQFLCNVDLNIMQKYLNTDNVVNNKLQHIIQQFATACQIADLSFDELYSLYIMKNCLNGFRQANGYKEGTYIKNWISADGQQYEDNVMCQEIWESLEDQNYDNLTTELQKYYDHMINTFDL